MLAQVLEPLTAAPEQLAQAQQQLCIEASAVLQRALHLEVATFGCALAQGQRWSHGQKQLLAFCVQHRQQWLHGLCTAARLLNAAADGGPGGIQSWEGARAGAAASASAALGLPPQQLDRAGDHLICSALNAATGAETLISYLYASPPVRQLVAGAQPPAAWQALRWPESCLSAQSTENVFVAARPGTLRASALSEREGGCPPDPAGLPASPSSASQS